MGTNGYRVSWAATYGDQEDRRRIRRVRLRDDSQSPQAIIELDWIGGGREGDHRCRSVSFYFSLAVEGIRLCILPADHRHDHSECCPP